MRIVLVSGGFDPIHSGHIAYFKEAKTLGDMLIVGLNSDEWLERKKGKAFMPWNERLCIINNLSMVDEVYTFDDDDNTAKHFIQQARAHYPNAELIFANGGDRTADNIPEMDIIDTNLKFVFKVGGDNKKNSSSLLLEKWRNNNMNLFRDQEKFMRACDQTVGEVNYQQYQLYKRLIEEEFNELKSADSSLDELDALIDILVVTIGAIHSGGFDAEGAWKEVMRSNFAKIDKETGKVRKREDGKVLKPVGWTPPDLRSYIKKD